MTGVCSLTHTELVSIATVTHSVSVTQHVQLVVSVEFSHGQCDIAALFANSEKRYCLLLSTHRPMAMDSYQQKINLKNEVVFPAGRPAATESRYQTEGFDKLEALQNFTGCPVGSFMEHTRIKPVCVCVCVCGRAHVCERVCVF